MLQEPADEKPLEPVGADMQPDEDCACKEPAAPHPESPEDSPADGSKIAQDSQRMPIFCNDRRNLPVCKQQIQWIRTRFAFPFHGIDLFAGAAQ